MKPSLFAVALFAAGALGGTGLAQGAPAVSPSGGDAATQPAAAGPHKVGYDPNSQICKWTEEIGTRLGRTRTCMTRAQWDELGRSGQEQLNDASRRSGEMGSPGSGG
jgi:hypothetical protein